MENQHNKIETYDSNGGILSFARVDKMTPKFSESDYSWEQALRVLRKNRKTALTLALGLTALIAVIAFLMRDVYQPTARIEIAPPSSGIKTLHEIESTTESENLDYLETQAQILRSDALAVSVIRGLNLDRNTAFVGSQLSAKSERSKIPAFQSSTIPENGNVYLQAQLDLATLTPAESAALEQFRKSLSVGTIRNTRLIEVSYASHDPHLARQITNTLVANFIDQSYQHRYTSTMQASEWLSSQLNDLHEKMQVSTRAVAKYQQKYGLVEMDDHDIPLTQMMGEINHQLSDAQASRIEQEASIRMIDSGQADAVPSLRDDQVYQSLLLQYADLRGQLAQARTVYGDSNANVKKLEEHLAELATQITSERSRMAARARSSFAAAQQREKMMLKEREKLRAQMDTASSQLVGYHLLKNEAIATAELYNTLQARLKEAGIYAGLRSTNIRVVDLAPNLQKPSGPHRALMISSGLLMSCLIGAAFCFLKESFNNTLRTPDDVKLWTGLPTLALLPAVINVSSTDKSVGHMSWKLPWSPSPGSNGQSGVSVMKSLTAESEAIRDLRTALLHRKPHRASPIVLVTSSVEGEGKTTVAVNLAIALAQLGRTCLVDADLRQPKVSQAFGLDPKTGLAELLRGNTQLAGAMTAAPGFPNLSIMASGISPDSPADTLSSAHMADLCAELRKEFAFVVIDTPPVIRFSDARFLACLANDVVLVGRCGLTTRRAIQRATELLNEVNAPFAGVVLNGIDLSSPDFHYFTYGYSRESEKRSKEYLQKRLTAVQSQDDQRPNVKGAHA
jgi:succinoglycan biosynthesis transport protein ExoP